MSKTQMRRNNLNVIEAKLKEFLELKGFFNPILVEREVDYYSKTCLVHVNEFNEDIHYYFITEEDSSQNDSSEKPNNTKNHINDSQYISAQYVYLDKKRNLQFKKISSFIESFNSFYDLMTKYFSQKGENEREYQYFFRGHASTKYSCKPGIYREEFKSLIEKEDTIFKEAIRRSPSDFTYQQSTFDKLVKMQHYELPTRLFDITTNPLVALYFACSDLDKEDGEFLIFKVPKADIKYFDSDTVSVVANLARVPHTLKSTDNSDLNDYLVHEIRHEKSHFTNNIESNDLESVLCVLPKLDNPRINKQAGAFFLFGISNDNAKSATLKYIPQRVTIGGRGKKKILQELSTLGINHASLFPEIDKILQNIKRDFA